MLRSLVLLAALVPLAAAGAGLVGAETCKACHAAAYEAWRDSPHARALDRLPEQSRRDSRCTGCHAPDQDSGFAGVSCEACHGPGQMYAARYVMRDPELARAVGLRDPGEPTCARCHDESTPSLQRFDYTRKLPLIEHWAGERAGARKKAAAPVPSGEPPAPGRR